MNRQRIRRFTLLRAAFVPLALIPPGAGALQLERDLGTWRKAPAPRAAPPTPIKLLASPTLAQRPAQPAASLPKPPPPVAAGSAIPPEGPRPSVPGLQPLVVTLKVNSVPKGDRYVLMDGRGGFLLKRADLDDAAGVTSRAPGVAFEGEDYVSVASIPGLRAELDEGTLTLSLSFPPETLPRQLYDLKRADGPVDITEPPTSALLNYRLGYAGVEGDGAGTLSLAADTAFSFGGWTLRNQSYHARGTGESVNTRLETQAIRDDRANLRRLILGDAVTPGLPLGASVPFAGVTFAKTYALDPTFNRQPAAGYRGLAEFPSQVDFYVGNTLVTRQQVAPGPYDISNFSYFGGRRDVRVVVRDAFGRQQTFAYPFYFAAQGLAAGLHDYSYQMGWIRNSSAGEEEGYGPWMASAFHQYGVSDALTLGLRGEASASAANGGADMFLRNPSLGLFEAHLSASRDRESGRGGWATSFAHSLQYLDFSSQVLWQRFSDDYAVLHTGVVPKLPERDFSASVAYSAGWLGSFGVGYTSLKLRGEPLDRSVSFNYSFSIPWGLSLTATVRRSLEGARGTEAFIGLQYLPKPTATVGLSYNKTLEGSRTTSFTVSNNVPSGEGIAYSFAADRQEDPTGAVTRSLAPRLGWYTRYGLLQAEAIHLRGDRLDASTGYTFSVSGAVVAAGRHVALTRPVTDSFAVVQIEPPLEGIRVYENSQEVGRTDAAGRVLLPNVSSYARNLASIQDKDVPIQYYIDRAGRSFAPPYRSGTVVRFDVVRIRAYTGTFTYREGGIERPLEYHVVKVAAGGREHEIPTARGGDFYAENLGPGDHPASVLIAGYSCRFTLKVPASEEDAVILGKLTTCEISR